MEIIGQNNVGCSTEHLSIYLGSETVRVSGIGTLAADPLFTVGCKIRPPWIRLILAHLTDTQSDCDLWSL